MKKEELIIECKRLAIKINELKKDIKKEKHRWFSYYCKRNWRSENKEYIKKKGKEYREKNKGKTK